MNLQKKKVISVFIVFMLLMVSVFSVDISENVLKAATKTILSASEMAIGIGTYGGERSNFNKAKDKFVFNVKNPVKNAKYTFDSSNKKIVTVKNSGTKAYLTGIGYGTATITCKQILNGKTTTVGKSKVTVKKAYIREDGMKDYLHLGSGRLGSYVQEPLVEIYYRNPEAKYVYSSDSSDFTITEKKYTEHLDAGDHDYAQEYTAKKAGSYTVTVKETYKNKTRKVGTFKVTVHNTEYVEALNIDLEFFGTVSDIIKYEKSDMNYYIEGDGFDLNKKSEDSVIYLDSDDRSIIWGYNEGTVKVKIYEGTNEANKKYITTCTITVKAVPLEGVDF